MIVLGEARRSVEMVSNNSIKLLTEVVGLIMYTSFPRTVSLICIAVSPSVNWPILIEFKLTPSR